jgi:hypothetical protein
MFTHGHPLVRENRIIIQIVKELGPVAFAAPLFRLTESLQHGAHYTRLIQFVNPHSTYPIKGIFHVAFRCGDNRPVPVPSPESIPSRVRPPEGGLLD